MKNEQEFRQYLEDYSNKTVDTWKDNIDMVVESLNAGVPITDPVFREQFKYWVLQKQESGIRSWSIFLLFKFEE